MRWKRSLRQVRCCWYSRICSGWIPPHRLHLALARRRAPAKLMLIATERPVDMVVPEHPLKALKQDLLLHQLCREIALEPLSERK